MSFEQAMQGAAQLLDMTNKNVRYKTDPALWAKEVLDFHMWSKQREVAEALLKYKKVAVSSCHGSGKSALATVLNLWWACTRLEQDSIAIVTAPTYHQVHAIIYEAMRKLHSKMGLPGHITLADEWKDDQDNIIGFGRKPSDQNDSAFQGIHRTGGVLVTLDEACGIHESIFVGAEAITTGNLDKILAIFNPDDVNSYIGKVWQRQDPSWHFITISAFETPNFTGEWVPDIARNGLISPAWVEEKKISWGEDSPRYKSKILGEFSLETTSTLFSPADILRGTSTVLEVGRETQPVLGVDVARYGEDDTAVYSYHDGVARLVEKWNKTDLVRTSERIVDIAVRLGVSEVRIDGVGIGAGVYDMVAHAANNRFEVIGIYGNGASPDIDKWINHRAFLYDNVRERMYNHKIDIDIQDQQLIDELGDIKYHFKNNRNSLQIEKKEDLRQRTGKSPDHADAFIYACADLGIDPTDPLSKLAPGEQFYVAMEEALYADELMVSPW